MMAERHGNRYPLAATLVFIDMQPGMVAGVDEETQPPGVVHHHAVRPDVDPPRVRVTGYHGVERAEVTAAVELVPLRSREDGQVDVRTACPVAHERPDAARIGPAHRSGFRRVPQPRPQGPHEPLAVALPAAAERIADPLGIEERAGKDAEAARVPLHLVEEQHPLGLLGIQVGDGANLEVGICPQYRTDQTARPHVIKPGPQVLHGTLAIWRYRDVTSNEVDHRYSAT